MQDVIDSIFYSQFHSTVIGDPSISDITKVKSIQLHKYQFKANLPGPFEMHGTNANTNTILYVSEDVFTPSTGDASNIE